MAAPSISDVIHGHPMYINIAVQYVRPRQVTYIRETLQGIIRELMEAVDLDLESDPTVVSIVTVVHYLFVMVSPCPDPSITNKCRGNAFGDSKHEAQRCSVLRSFEGP